MVNNTHRTQVEAASRYSHTHPCVVDQVLQGVAAGEDVHHLLTVGNCVRAGIQGVDHPRYVNKLNAGEVREEP